MIYQGTNVVTLDEPCLGLFELNYKTPNQKARHRYQIILVMRNDKPAEFRRDLGLTSKFKGKDQFRIPGGIISKNKVYIEHTVGELKDIADALRVKRPFDKRELVGVDKINE